MLALEVTLLTGRYVATAHDERSRAEWPPHPARLFSALAAAYFEAADERSVAAEERAALEWLEEQGAPAIHASAASERDVVTVFVPVNDTTVVGSLDDELAAVDVARAELANKEKKARGAAEKKLAKVEARLAQATKQAIAAVAPGKETKEGPDLADSLIPERRKKQPRTFPSVTPQDSRVVFAWSHASPSDEQRRILDSLAARVVRLGHSSSLVSVRVSDGSPVPTWVPDEIGEVFDDREEHTLRVVSKGQLIALDEVFALQRDAPGRVMPAAFHRYVSAGAVSSEPLPSSVFGEDWIVLRRLPGKAGGAYLPSTRAVDVARILRRALLSSYGDVAPEVLCGHGEGGGPSGRAHAAYVPLPLVGTPHADGSIVGVAIVLPRGATRDERRSIARALERWHQTNGRKFDDDAERRSVPLHFGRAGELWLSLLDEMPRDASPLSTTAWCRPSRLWASATPIALDRNPGELRSKDPKVEADAYTQAERTVTTACEHVGLPQPSKVIVTPAAPLSGGDKTRAFPPFKAGKASVQRVLVHAVIQFDALVRGPILLGAGRYVGLGLFRPIEDRND